MASLSSSALAFDNTNVGATSQKILTVSNIGTETLSITSIAIIGTDVGQFRVSPTTVSVPPQETRVLTVRYRPLPGRELSGRLTLFSNDPVQPQVGVSWSALEVQSPYLQLTRISPADATFGVALASEIQLTFSEPLFFRRDFTALDVQLLPEPLSGPILDDLQMRGDGRTVVIPVQLARDQVYRQSAGRAGPKTELSQPLQCPDHHCV